MQSHKEEFERRGVVIAVISFAPPEKLVLYQHHRNWPFLMLSDAERAAYGYFELGKLSWLQLFGAASIKLYARLILMGRRFQSYGKDDYRQGGGDFILDRQGTILYAHRSENPADRPPPEVLIKAIDRQGEGETR